jgi:transposase-like protein
MQNGQPKYDESFKKSLVNLHQSGKSQTQLHNEYGVSFSALSKWIKQYSELSVFSALVPSRKLCLLALRRRFCA